MVTGSLWPHLCQRLVGLPHVQLLYLQIKYREALYESSQHFGDNMHSTEGLYVAWPQFISHACIGAQGSW